jgi:hypothetical protein
MDHAKIEKANEGREAAVCYLRSSPAPLPALKRGSLCINHEHFQNAAAISDLKLEWQRHLLKVGSRCQNLPYASLVI